MSNEGWPDKMLRLPVKETLVRLAHIAFDHLQHETPSDYPKHPVEVLKGELKPVDTSLFNGVVRYEGDYR